MDLHQASKHQRPRHPHIDVGLFCYGYRLCGGTGPRRVADDACVVADDHGLLSFVAHHFLKLEYSDRADINTDIVTIALVVID